ncbi:flagellar biosynthesis, cell-distal portion of basal-body rod [Klebsiella quasipneumoniae]|uniref:hypothetical protein n=3 Tax=Klebsiella quasipneumoniae TaxID=1463165 RepID=UPI0010912477|nr:hypothetical protein [Klebsiella quasipneumoniae]VGL06184.1 flagellar biosynthesis, cell-distal portion of basal-body rod [Klebsiella quasipneumoniae]
MAGFDPALGSTSPAVLLDNAKRLDELVNGEQSTVDDRSGEPLHTWRGITADIESVLASLDTSNSTFPDEPSGIAGTTNGQYFRTPQGTESSVAFRYFVNANGVAQEVAWLLGAQRFFDFLYLFNSMFSTSGVAGFDAIFSNTQGLYVGGIDSSGALNFGKMIANLAAFASADIKSLTTESMKLASGAEVTSNIPPGFEWALMSLFGSAAVGLKDDGTFAAGKLQALVASIGKLLGDIVFHGGGKTTGVLPEGFLWGWMDDYGRVTHGGKTDGSVETGTIKVKRLIAGSIESDSLPVDKKPLAKRLTDVNHIIGFGQSLMAGINSMPLQTITAIPNAYRFNGGVRAQEGSGTSAENHASLLPYIETTHDTGDGVGYETPLGGAITAIFDRLSAEADGYASGDVKILGSVPAQGSKTIAQLRQNPGLYMQRIIDDMTYGKARANELGLTYSPHAMIYMGNESDQTAGTTEEVYLDSFDKMIAAVNGFASDVTGKTESLPWFIYQFNSWKNRTPNTSYPTIPLALLKLARTRDDVRLVQPMYMYDYYDTAHLLGLDSKICGYRFGLAIEQEMLTGKKFEPLWAQDVSLQGGIANIWYDPVGKLVMDTSIVTDPGNYGVSAIDPSGNALSLTEVSVHLNRLRVRASGGIPAGSKIRLGFTGGTTGTLPSRTNGPRCCLRDSQGDTIKFDPNGVAYRMDNYAIVEEITLN